MFLIIYNDEYCVWIIRHNQPNFATYCTNVFIKVNFLDLKTLFVCNRKALRSQNISTFLTGLSIVYENTIVKTFNKTVKLVVNFSNIYSNTQK